MQIQIRMDLYHFGNLDPDPEPHQSEKQDPDPHQDLHQNADPQHWFLPSSVSSFSIIFSEFSTGLLFRSLIVRFIPPHSD
jgi:hypothetical protein